jgi:hypothetical protein
MARKERYEYACSQCSNNCWGCFYAEECPVWNDQQDAEPIQIPATEVYISLCEGRHEIPQAIDGSIFGTELDPLDLSGMEREAAEQLRGVFTLNLYVTGLTVALVAVLNVCREQKIKVTLYHYNRETGDYYPQEVK